MTSPTVRIETDGRESNVSIRCASFESALRVAWRNYCFPPDGYRLDRAGIMRRNHSGRRMVLRLSFLHADRRVTPFTQADAFDLFDLDARVAAGEAEYPPEKEEQDG